jgi:hypothetical protein
MIVKKVRSAVFLSRVVKRLKSDLERLKDAYGFADTATREFLGERTNDAVIHDVSIGYAAWVHCAFGDDLDKYTQFLEKALESRKENGKTLFGWDDPSAVTPCYEAERLLYRVDLGLHFVQRRLRLKLPRVLRVEPGDTYSIRSEGGKAAEILQQVGAFVDAANDLFVSS